MSVLLSGYTITKPSVGPTLAVGSSTGGLSAGTYSYICTFVTAFGETDAGTASSNVTALSSGSVNLTAIPLSTDGNVTARRLYRTQPAGNGGGATSIYRLIVTIADNITTTYTDISSDASISSNAAPPLVNTANSRQTLNGSLVISAPTMFSFENAITATGASQAAAYPLTKEFSIVSTVGASTGVVLPLITANTVGMHMFVSNDSGTTLNIYPQSTQAISVNGASLGASTPTTLGTNGHAEFLATTPVLWNRTR